MLTGHYYFQACGHGFLEHGVSQLSEKVLSGFDTLYHMIQVGQLLFRGIVVLKSDKVGAGHGDFHLNVVRVHNDGEVCLTVYMGSVRLSRECSGCHKRRQCEYNFLHCVFLN